MIQRQIFEYNNVIGYRFIPNIKARIHHESGAYLIRTNDCGFRCNHDFHSHKKNGINRVLIFGDSFTAGDGVSNINRYSDIIEKKYESIEVFNYGLPGSGTDQQYLAYQTFGSDIKHDVLVLAVLVENIRRVNSHYRYFEDDKGNSVMYAKPYYILEKDELILKQCPPPKGVIKEEDLSVNERKFIYSGGGFQGLRNLVSRMGFKQLVEKTIRYQPVPEYNSASNQAWLVMRKILQDWIEKHQKPVILMPIPLYQHVEGTSESKHYMERFKELSDATGCVLHDPLIDLLKYTPEQRRAFRFEHDIHLTPKGHEALAASLAPVIEETLRTHRSKE